MSLMENSEPLPHLPPTPPSTLPFTPTRSRPHRSPPLIPEPAEEDADAATTTINKTPSLSPQQSPSVTPPRLASDLPTDADESPTRFGIRKWWRSNLDSAKRWWEMGVNDFNEQAELALAKMRSQAAATEADEEKSAIEGMQPDVSDSANASAPAGEKSGQGSVLAASSDAEIGVADKWKQSLKTMQLQTATALQVTSPARGSPPTSGFPRDIAPSSTSKFSEPAMLRVPSMVRRAPGLELLAPARLQLSESVWGLPPHKFLSTVTSSTNMATMEAVSATTNQSISQLTAVSLSSTGHISSRTFISIKVLTHCFWATKITTQMEDTSSCRSFV